MPLCVRKKEDTALGSVLSSFPVGSGVLTQVTILMSRVCTHRAISPALPIILEVKRITM